MESVNEKLTKMNDAAQVVLNENETLFDEETITTLKDAISAAQKAKVEIPDKMQVFEKLSLDETAKSKELKSLKEKAETDLETMKGIEVSEVPEVPDYTDIIKMVSDALAVYEDSVQSLKQITAPTDNFVMERLQRVDTITAMAAVTEDHDPNGQLGKQGGYIGCIYWSDSQIDSSKTYNYSGDVIEVGTVGGGAIEIYNTENEAKKRNEYLSSFDGTGVASGSHYVYGTIVIRTSDYLSGEKQQGLNQKVLEVLTTIDR